MTKSTVSRRAVVGGTAAGGLVALSAIAATGTGGVDRISRKMRLMLKDRTRPASLATAEVEDWMVEIGSQFRLVGYRLRLTGVRRLPLEPRPVELRQKPFIAVFDLLSRHTLPGNLIYPIGHPRYPPFEIYLTNAPTSWHPRRMQALFG